MGGGAIPSAPTNLSATPGNTNALIAFTAPAMNGATLSRYEYQLNSTTGTWVSIGTVTSYTIPNLLNGTSYTIYVRAFTTSGLSGNNASIPVTPVNNSPIANPVVTMSIINSVSLQWTVNWSATFDSRDMFDYVVYYTTDYATQVRKYSVTQYNQAPIVITGLTPDYYYYMTLVVFGTSGKFTQLDSKRTFFYA